jgi:hypothetical protein
MSLKEDDTGARVLCADTAYILSFSIIMLNTDQHNPAVRTRMSKADFVRNNRGVNSGADLPSHLLEVPTPRACCSCSCCRCWCASVCLAVFLSVLACACMYVCMYV